MNTPFSSSCGAGMTWALISSPTRPAAAKVGEVVSVHVIPRPHDDLSHAVPSKGETARKGPGKA